MFLQQYPEFTKILNIDPILFGTKEGKSSMYLDLVEKKMGPCSYVEKDQYYRIPENGDGRINTKEFLNIWDS